RGPPSRVGPLRADGRRDRLGEVPEGRRVSRIRVLVVDDSSFMRGVIARTVASDPRFEVVGQAGDGAEALSLVKQLSPDVVSMDFNMPGVNGAEATRRILAEKPVPIVMLSAHTKEGASATV